MRKNILIIFIVIIVLIAFPLSLAFSKGGYKSIPKSQNIDIFNEIEKAYNQEGNIEVSEELINSILAQAFKKPLNKGNISIEDGYFYIDDDKINLCLKSSYKGKTLYPSISAKLDYSDEGISMYITKFNIGYLTVPKSILINSMKKFSNDDVKVLDDKILISKYLLPYNTNKIYVKDKKIVIEIKKDLAAIDNKNTEDKKQSNNNKQGNINSNTTAPNQKNSNSKTENKQAQNNTDTAKIVNDNKKSLIAVSSQLNGAISSVKTSKEKKILQTIQNVVSEVSKNPSYPYKAEAYKVINDYKSLNIEEKERVKKAILNNVDTKNVIKLISIFGL